MVSSVLQSHSSQTSAETLLRIRHTCAHVLAMAAQTLFPETKVTIGPWTETGFYYDFDRQTPFIPDDLTQIEAEMRRIIQANLPIIQEGRFVCSTGWQSSRSSNHALRGNRKGSVKRSLMNANSYFGGDNDKLDDIRNRSANSQARNARHDNYWIFGSTLR